VAQGRAPVYVVHFTQLEAAQSAQDFTSINVCTREEKNALGNGVGGFKFTSPYGPEIKKWLKHGIGLHHAGLLPKVPGAGRAISAEGVAQDHRRHDARRGHQRSHPHRAVLAALQV